MKIDFSAVMKDLDGGDLTLGDLPLTLGKVAAYALNAPISQAPDPLDPVRRGTLALQLNNAGADTDITPEDASLIRECLPRYWTPIVVAQAHALLGG